MKAQSGDDLGHAVLQVLGIPSDNVTALSIDMQAGKVAHVIVTRVIVDTEAADILRELENYAVARKAEA